MKLCCFGLLNIVNAVRYPSNAAKFRNVIMRLANQSA